ncbi:MAG: T9SS type A sorting domain-containing protein [Bacteroidia bacterium]
MKTQKANSNSQTSINTAKLNLSSGIYVVLLSTPNESNSVKLLIN